MTRNVLFLLPVQGSALFPSFFPSFRSFLIFPSVPFPEEEAEEEFDLLSVLFFPPRKNSRLQLKFHKN